MNMMMPLMILLVSCVSIPHAPLYDISFKFNRCRLRCYDFNKLKTVEDSKCGPEFVSGNYSLDRCEQLLAIDAEFFAEELKPAIRFNQRQCE